MSATNSFWTRKYRQHIAEMIGLCYRYVPDRATAEDLAHDAFLRAIEKVDSLRVTESFRAWLTRITINTVMEYLRVNARITTVDAEKIAADTPELAGDISPESMMETIRQADFSHRENIDAIAQLPDHHRTVLNLYVFERFTHKQIAEKLNISPNTSKSHLMRARKELQMILFNKSKQKNRPLMTLFLPIFGVDAAIDRYCRRHVGCFALPPQHPLNTSNVASASSHLPLRMRYHALRGPLAAGLGTAAVGAILFPAIPHHPQPVVPIAPKRVPAVTVSEPTTDTTMADITEMSTETVPLQTAKTKTSSEYHEADVNPEDPPDTASAGPVVVKKIVRRSKRTIVIKDSNNR